MGVVPANFTPQKLPHEGIKYLRAQMSNTEVPKSYDVHPRQVKYESLPPGYLQYSFVFKFGCLISNKFHFSKSKVSKFSI